MVRVLLGVENCPACGRIVSVITLPNDSRLRYVIHAKDGKHCEKSLELVPVVIDEFAGAPDDAT